MPSQIVFGQRLAPQGQDIAAHRERFASLALPLAVALAALAWAGVPWGTFQFDDFLNVVRDPATTDPAALLERLRHGLRPLTRLSYFADARLFGLHAAGFLTVNLLLHLVTAALVFALARRRAATLAAFLAALFFALQPANAEVVAYVSGRSTGLMTPLLLAGLLLYDRGRRVGAYLFFALACLAKEVALIFPLLLLAWEATRGKGELSRPREISGRGAHSSAWRQPIVRETCIALLLAGAIVAALLLRDGYQSILSYSIELRPLLENLLANARAIPIMLSLWARPWALSADHDFDATGHLTASIVGIAFLGSIVWRGDRRAQASPLARAGAALAPDRAAAHELGDREDRPGHGEASVSRVGRSFDCARCRRRRHPFGPAQPGTTLPDGRVDLHAAVRDGWRVAMAGISVARSGVAVVGRDGEGARKVALLEQSRHGTPGRPARCRRRRRV